MLDIIRPHAQSNTATPMSKPFAALFTALLLTLVSVQAYAGYRIETVVENLEHPWSMAWLPDGRMLVTERPGRLRMIDDGELLPEAISGLPQPHVRSQAGLFEVLPAEDFAESGHLYLSYASGDAADNTLRVVRGTLDGLALTDVEEIFRAEPTRGTSVHYGGRMLFLPDGSLIVSVGDAFDHREEAQNIANHFGTIVRLNTDGSVPGDNPLLDETGARPEIYSYGHRNIQGLALDPETGVLWSNEHGPRGGDEINRILPGANYGWPAATHGVDYSGARISPYRELPGMESPKLVWTPASAPSGLAVYRGDLFPEWNGNLLSGGLVSRAVHRLEIDGDGVTEAERLFESLESRIRDVRVGPDGAIYLLTDSPAGRLLRVTPEN